MTDKTRKAAAAVAVDAEAASPQADAPTLRDRFAMRAPAIPSWWTNAYMARTGHTVIDTEAVATWAYEYADAMVVERAK